MLELNLAAIQRKNVVAIVEADFNATNHIGWLRIGF